MNLTQAPLFGGKTIEEWDRMWVAVEGGLRRYHPDLRYKVGLYRCWLGGRIVALGTGTDKSGGMAKRLSDFRRSSDSSRDYYAGELIYANRDDLVVEVLISGSDSDARDIAKQLKWPMIRLHRPTWTVAKARFRPTRRVRSSRRAAARTGPPPIGLKLPRLSDSR